VAPGSVGAYIINPNSQFTFIQESTYFGLGENKIGGPFDLKLVAQGTGKNVVVANLSGSSDWSEGHLVLGTYHFWVQGGKLYLKNGAPTTSTDGTIVGTQT
jgi:hypothetical protein